MLKTSIVSFNAIILAGLLGIVTPSLAAPPEGKGGSKDKGGDRVISVEWRRDVWQAPEIKTMDESGNNKFTVNTDPDLLQGGYPRWSPDGLRSGGYHKRSGAKCYGWGRAIMSIQSDGTDEQVVLTDSVFDAFNVARGLKSAGENCIGVPFGLAAWSPEEGTSMVFSGLVRYPAPPGEPYDLFQSRIFTVSFQDGAITAEKTLTVLTDEAAKYDDRDPHWSPVLDTIVFVSTRTGWPELWAIDPDGANLQQITDLGLRGMYYPVWSHGGDPFAGIASIAVSVDLGNPSPVRYFATDRDLWILDVDLNDPDPVTKVTHTAVRADPEFIEGLAAWSPDDSRLVIARLTDANSRNSRTQIVIVDLATDAEKTLVDSTKQAVLFPDWKP